MTFDWKYKKISGSLHPRQFEYHPLSNDLLFGTIGGYVYNANLASDSIRNLGKYGVNNLDSILGLCWLKNSSSKFIVGSSMGQVACGDNRSGFNGLISGRSPSIIKEYPAFDKLTCICVNSSNDYILASGYSCDARIYDLETGIVSHEYKDAHMSHINISRFANHSPKLFTTSSFDGTAKSWDLRMNTEQPIYTMQCQSSIVMISYSPDDTFILASALDNEISQFLTVDGRKHTSFQVPKTGLESNFTRAYYSASGAYVVTGACEESNVSMLCASTGRLLARCDMYPDRMHSSLYIQSLRGNPKSDSSFCVLANYKDIPKRELVVVDIPSSSSSMAFKSMPLKADCHASQMSIGHQHIEHHTDSSRSKQSDAFHLLSASLINAPLSSPLSLPSPGLVRDLKRLRVSEVNVDSALDIVKQLNSILTDHEDEGGLVVKEFIDSSKDMDSIPSGNSNNEDIRTELLNMVEILANRTLKDSYEREGRESHIRGGGAVDTLLVVFTIENEHGVPVEGRPSIAMACAVYSSIICACSPVLRRLLLSQSKPSSKSTFRALEITSIVPPSLSYLLPLLLDNLLCVEGKKGADWKLLKSLRCLCVDMILKNEEEKSQLSINRDSMHYISSLESSWKHTTVARWMVAAVKDLLSLAISLQLGDFVGNIYRLFIKLLSVSTVLDILSISTNRLDIRHDQTLLDSHPSSFLVQLQEGAVKFLMLHWDIVLTTFPYFKAAVKNCFSSNNKADEKDSTTIGLTENKPLEKCLNSTKLDRNLVDLLVKRREECVAKAREVQLNAEIHQDLLLQLRLSAANLKQGGPFEHAENEGLLDDTLTENEEQDSDAEEEFGLAEDLTNPPPPPDNSPATLGGVELIIAIENDVNSYFGNENISQEKGENVIVGEVFSQHLSQLTAAAEERYLITLLAPATKREYSDRIGSGYGGFSKIPKMVGQSCSLVMGNTMMVTGGRNRYRYHCQSTSYSFNIDDNIWTILPAEGVYADSTATLLYHCSVPLMKHDSRYVVSIGGRLGTRTRDHTLTEEEEVSKQIQLLDCLSLQWSSPSVSHMDSEKVPSYFPNTSAPSSSSSLSLRTRHSVCAVYEEDLTDTVILGDKVDISIQEKSYLDKNSREGSSGGSSAIRDWWSQPASAFSATQCSNSCEALLLATDPTEILNDLSVDRVVDDDPEDDGSDFNEDDVEDDLSSLMCSLQGTNEDDEALLKCKKKGIKKDGGAATIDREPSMLILQAEKALKEREAIMGKKETVTLTTKECSIHVSSIRNDHLKGSDRKDCRNKDVSARGYEYAGTGNSIKADEGFKDDDMNIDASSCSINNEGSNSNRKVITMFIVFGGFCTKERAFKGDIEVIVCTADTPSSPPSPDSQFPRFAWQCTKPLFTSTLYTPSPRLGHTACTVIRGAKEGGPRMVIYGGLGINELFDDVYSLRCGDINNMQWENTSVRGVSPGHRHGHSMVSLPATQDENVSLMVVCGGVWMAPNTTAPTHHSGQCMNDVWVLRMDSASRDSSVGLSLTWIQVKMLGMSPSPRGRHQSVVSKGKGSQEGKILIFGGSDEWYAHQGGNQNSLEVDSQVFMINTDKEIVRRFKKEDDTYMEDGDNCEYEWIWESPSCGIIDNQLLMTPSTLPAAVPTATIAQTTLPSTIFTTIPTPPFPLPDSHLSYADINNDISPIPSNSIDKELNKDTLSANLLCLLLRSQGNKDDDSKECSCLDTDLVIFSIQPIVSDDDDSEIICPMNDDESVKVTAVNFTAHVSIVTARCKMLKSLLDWERQKIATRDINGCDGEGVSDQVQCSEQLTVEIRDCSPPAFAALLLYLYTDVLLVDSEHLMSVLALAHQYGLKHLESLCEGYLCRQVLVLSQEHLNSGCGKDLTGVWEDPKVELHRCSMEKMNDLTIDQEKDHKIDDEGNVVIDNSLDCDPILQLLQYADLYHLKVLKSVCFSSVLRNFNPFSLLSEVSAELIEEVEIYRLSQRHAYMIDHHPRNIK